MTTDPTRIDPATGASPALRASLALALDTDDLVDALRTARELAPWLVAKVGLELSPAWPAPRSSPACSISTSTCPSI
jgi:hypothetical protein